MDLFPTILDIVGLSDRAKSAVDGVSLAPLLRQTGSFATRPLFWHYPHYQHYQLEGTTPYGAIRRGDWRLIEFYDDQRVELYNLHDDPGERNDLSKSSADRARTLRDELHVWLRQVGAQMPTRNPHYDSTKPEHTPKRKQAAKPS